MEKSSLIPSVRVSGGTPAGMPDYKPINRLARHELAGLLRPIKPALFQVFVYKAGEGRIAVGPRCPLGVADAFAGAIRTQIGLGRERIWNDPQVIPVGGFANGN